MSRDRERHVLLLSNNVADNRAGDSQQHKESEGLYNLDPSVYEPEVKVEVKEEEDEDNYAAALRNSFLHITAGTETDPPSPGGHAAPPARPPDSHPPPPPLESSAQKQRSLQCSQCSFHALSVFELFLHSNAKHKEAESAPASAPKKPRTGANADRQSDAHHGAKKSVDLEFLKRHLERRRRQGVVTPKPDVGSPLTDGARRLIDGGVSISVLRQCGECSFQTADGAELARHKDSVHNSADQLRCVHCRYKTTSRVLLAFHLEQKHPHQSTAAAAAAGVGLNDNVIMLSDCVELRPSGSKAGPPPPPRPGRQRGRSGRTRTDKAGGRMRVSAAESQNTIPLGGLSHTCDFCLYEAPSKIQLIMHEQSAHPTLMPGRAKSRPADRREAAAGSNSAPHKCPRCSYSSMQKADLNRHVSVVHSDSVYGCNLCTFKTTFYHFVKIHMKRVHLVDEKVVNIDPFKMASPPPKVADMTDSNQAYMRTGKGFQCLACEYSTPQQVTMRRHVESLHLGIKYKCDQCAFQTSLDYMFKKHKKYKHGVKPPGSGGSDKGLLTASSAAELVIEDKDETSGYFTDKVANDGKFQCTRCSYRSFYKSVMLRHCKAKHVKNNILLSCDQCSFTSFYKRGIAAHQKACHEAGGPFVEPGSNLQLVNGPPVEQQQQQQQLPPLGPIVSIVPVVTLDKDWAGEIGGGFEAVLTAAHLGGSSQEAESHTTTVGQVNNSWNRLEENKKKAGKEDVTDGSEKLADNDIIILDSSEKTEKVEVDVSSWEENAQSVALPSNAIPEAKVDADVVVIDRFEVDEPTDVEEQPGKREKEVVVREEEGIGEVIVRHEYDGDVDRKEVEVDSMEGIKTEYDDNCYRWML